MGMYDYVDYTMPCPTCGNKVDGFQSKDGECLLSKLGIGEVDNFYTFCRTCGTWIEFNRKIKRISDISDFEMTVTPKRITAK